MADLGLGGFQTVGPARSCQEILQHQTCQTLSAGSYSLLAPVRRYECGPMATRSVIDLIGIFQLEHHHGPSPGCTLSILPCVSKDILTGADHRTGKFHARCVFWKNPVFDMRHACPCRQVVSALWRGQGRFLLLVWSSLQSAANSQARNATTLRRINGKSGAHRDSSI
jgi:hypothetical protein